MSRPDTMRPLTMTKELPTPTPLQGGDFKD